MAEYTFIGRKIEIPNPEDLSNTERAMLRGMAEPGAPLWKVLRKMVDYVEGLTQSLIGVDLLDPAEVTQARKVQATIQAAQWAIDTFSAALSDVEEPDKKED